MGLGDDPILYEETFSCNLGQQQGRRATSASRSTAHPSGPFAMQTTAFVRYSAWSVVIAVAFAGVLPWWAVRSVTQLRQARTYDALARGEAGKAATLADQVAKLEVQIRQIASETESVKGERRARLAALEETYRRSLDGARDEHERSLESARAYAQRARRCRRAALLPWNQPQ
jgi:hypothetical protein